MPNVKMGADISSFKSGISQAKSEVKTLDQQMKMLDATMKAEGKSEQVLNQQTQTLNSRMAAQKNIANQAEAALKQMSKNGIDPASESYQKMARELLAAQTGMMETQAALNNLGEGAVAAAGGVEKLESGLNGIGKKISLDQVINGIGKITSGLETAAKKAISLGQSIFDNIMDAAMWADDSATMAMMYGIDLDQFLRMQKLVQNGMDTSVDAILKSQSKLKKGVGDDSKATMDALKELGLGLRSGNILDPYSWEKRNPTELFWDAGKALMALGDEYEQEAKAQALFGKSWKELVPLFTEFSSQAEFDEALKNVNVESTESVKNLATLNDKMGELRGNFDTLSREILAQFAPGLIELSGSLNDLLTEIMKYLKSDEGKEALKSMSDSFTGLFDGLKNISAEDVVNKFKEVFDAVVGGFKWIKDNGDTLLGVLGGIGTFWATLKVSEGALNILKIVDGLKSLLGAGGAAGAAGGLWSGLNSKLMETAGTVAPLLGNAALQTNLPVVGDWLMNQTDVGMWLRGTKTPGDTWEDLKQDVQHNAETFESDWQNNVIYKALLAWGENNVRYWDQINKTNQKAAEWTLGDEFTSEELMQMINNGQPVPIQSDLDVETTAEDIAEQIGQVIIPGVVQVTGDPTYSRRTPGMQGIIPGYANGIKFVPDTRLAILHRGEEVRAAREVSSRNYSSNLYVEKMYMGGGTDARGLADEMAAAQRRQASGYGS